MICTVCNLASNHFHHEKRQSPYQTMDHHKRDSVIVLCSSFISEYSLVPYRNSSKRILIDFGSSSECLLYDCSWATYHRVVQVLYNILEVKVVRFRMNFTVFLRPEQSSHNETVRWSQCMARDHHSYTFTAKSHCHLALSTNGYSFHQGHCHNNHIVSNAILA
jgi:hypothetical protein